MILRILLFVAVLHNVVHGYIPALPTNDSSTAPDSTIMLRWTNQGSYGEQISRQLVRDGGSPGISKGALVHFVENVTIPADSEFTQTPWIAFISCDKNVSAPAFSDEVDIFTMARDRGAVAALLYSTTEESCLLNSFYLDPYEFQKVFDIYSTISKSSARLIESQFDGGTKSPYYYFDAERLNNSAAAINRAVQGGSVQEGYLISTLKLDNVTDPTTDSGDNGDGNNDDNNDNNDSGNKGTSLAMIILYAITGSVSALFCVVIITGAIRAFRHPERYGPRAGDPSQWGPGHEPQTRTAGITRAILDTFPVVKFGRGSTTNDNNSGLYPPSHRNLSLVPSKDKVNDVEAGVGGNTPPLHKDVDIELATRADNSPHDGQMKEVAVQEGPAPRGQDSTAQPRPSTSSSRQGLGAEPTMQNMGRETCPICILDFEEGDDVRILPCPGQHRFHRDCVDPWLLELSGSCPICRQDFTTLEHMVRGDQPEFDYIDEAPVPQQHSSHGLSRLARYMRLATHRRRNHGSLPPTTEETAYAHAAASSYP